MKKVMNGLISGYEDTRLIHYMDRDTDFPKTIAFEDLENVALPGVLKSSFYEDGKLVQSFSEKENHVCVVAATRVGKTTCFVIPQIISFGGAKIKRNLFIADPKGENHRTTGKYLEEQGYTVISFDLRNYLDSECWNPLTPIYRAFHQMLDLENEVTVVETKDGPRNQFRGVIYTNQRELDRKIVKMKKLMEEDVGNMIDTLAAETISTEKIDDPYWEDSARELLKAGIWGMLEDSVPGKNIWTLITEDTFSFSTLLTIFDNMRDEGSGGVYRDGGFFTDRKSDSRAYRFAKNCILENAGNTRRCIVSTFNTKMSIYKNSMIRLITGCNSFDMSRLVDREHPVAIFFKYRDETKGHYQIISSFIQNAYEYLIEYANTQPQCKLKVPFYFILDEFGNFPKIQDFETKISACAGRNIFFILVLQSYAQLNNIYGPAVSEIIRDNMNVHVFLGSNNPRTLDEFSQECGQTTRFSPISAFGGNKGEIERFQLETISLMPKSALAKLQFGECIITETNCGYVMFSKLEPYFRCPEMNAFSTAEEGNYDCGIDPLDDKYQYAVPKPKKKRYSPDFDF